MAEQLATYVVDVNLKRLPSRALERPNAPTNKVLEETLRKGLVELGFRSDEITVRSKRTDK